MEITSQNLQTPEVTQNGMSGDDYCAIISFGISIFGCLLILLSPLCGSVFSLISIPLGLVGLRSEKYGVLSKIGLGLSSIPFICAFIIFALGIVLYAMGALF